MLCDTMAVQNVAQTDKQPGPEVMIVSRMGNFPRPPKFDPYVANMTEVDFIFVLCPLHEFSVPQDDFGKSNY